MTYLGDPPLFSVPASLDLIRAFYATPLEKTLSKQFPGVDYALIEEAVQEACERADKSRAKYNPAKAKFPSYLCTIGKRVLLRKLKQAGAMAQPETTSAETGDDDDVDEPVGDEDADPSRKHEQARQMDRFLGEFNRLPERQRNVLHLCEGTQVPRCEAARMLGLTPRQVSYAWRKGFETLGMRLTSKPIRRKMPRGRKPKRGRSTTK